MAKSAKDKALRNGQARSASRSAGGRRVSKRQKPVTDIIPAKICSQLLAAINTSAPLLKDARELDRRFGIQAMYGVSHQRLWTFLKRSHQATKHDRAGANKKNSDEQAGNTAQCHADKAVEESHAQSGEEKESSNALVSKYRKRQLSVGAILDTTFGQLAKCNPDLWDRRAYLMLIGTLYEKLAINEDDLPTDELVALAKVLAENRRAEAHIRKAPVDVEAASPADNKGDPSDVLAEAVRRIYGAEVKIDGESAVASAP